MSCIRIIFCLCLSVITVSSMALHGGPLMRYDPCSLGFLYFDKLSEKFWQGVVNLHLYTNSTSKVEFSVYFEKQVKVYGASQNSTFKVRDSLHSYTFKTKDGVPSRYIFFIRIQSFETDVPTVKRFSINNHTLCDDVIKASQKVESLNVTYDSKVYKHICGRRAFGHAELTTVRTEAKAGDWPWHVAVFNKDATLTVSWYHCGGNIMSRTAIITAAHCVRKDGETLDAERVMIVAGISNHKDLNEVGRQTFIAQKVIVHPSYNDISATADLAVIKINKLKFTEFVQPICIWGPVYDKANLFGNEATVVGFGTTESNKPSDVLRSAFTMVQNDTTCIDYSPDLYRGLLNEFTFCAGFGPTSGINPRNGDSGGGLVIPTMQPDHLISWFLRGVLSRCGVSPGHTECDPKFYVVYTDVGPHYGWLYHHSGLQYSNNIMHDM